MNNAKFDYRDTPYYIKRLQERVFRRRRILKKRGRIKSSKSLCRFKYTNRLHNLFPLFLKHFEEKGFIKKEYVCSRIIVPQKFSFSEDFDSSIIFFKRLLSSFILSQENIILDFSQCYRSDIANFMLLNVIIDYLYKLLSNYNKDLYVKTEKVINTIPSNLDIKTNKFLAAFGYHNLNSQFDDKSKYLPLYLIKGKYKHGYRENTKAITTKQIVLFVQKSLSPYDISLTADTQNQLESFISEVLNNAEDHSIDKSEWFVNGISFDEVQHGTNIIEFNLSIMSIGPSMYEGFEQTKTENAKTYSVLEKLYNIHKQQFTIFKSYEREPLFMLYMLNEGISRLKYQEASRGNGTMNFIESFISLGNYGDINSNFIPKLNIISGHSVLSCDNKCKPYKKGNYKYISLNKEQDYKKLPDKDYISYNTHLFPGTILECKIFFNQEYINQQIENQDERETDD